MLDPEKLNNSGLEAFAAGSPKISSKLLEKAYRSLPNELGILVNLGLALMQQGKIEQAERCYRLALNSKNQQARRSASKNLGFLLLWRGEYQAGWDFHSQRFEGEEFLKTQWRGESLNGKVLTVWNDVGMGDAFQFVRYTLPLLERNEKVRFAVAASQISLFRKYLSWELTEVVDRRQIDHLNCGPHIPLMNLIPLLDPNTSWGRCFEKPTWRIPLEDKDLSQRVGLCWASNPQDRTMYMYKSIHFEKLLDVKHNLYPQTKMISLQTDEADAHQKLGLIAASHDWCETLLRIAGCNYVISVDTAVAHLAAGSNCPTTILIGDPPDWRWKSCKNQISRTSWYPNLHISPLIN